MQKLLPILFLIFIKINSFSQSLNEKLTDILSYSGNNMPADQVFLHLDRNLYHPGDTIRFQAYVRDRQTGIFETKSTSLYSLLLNTSHKTIDSARFRIINSTASGWLKIPDEAPFQDYSVLAFTSRMMNYDPEHVFSARIRSDKLRPAHMTSAQKGEKENAPSVQPDAAQELIDLRFLPEGGTFINGINQRLAFNAVTTTGCSVQTEGEIINQKGEKVCDFKSGKFGPGLIEFTPLSGYTYFATLRGIEFSGMKWPLQATENSGIALRVNSPEKGIISLEVEGKNVAGSTYILSLIMNDILVLSKEFNPESDLRLKISTEELPAGTAYITVFNSELKPIAERMVFVNSHKQLNIGISASASSYNRGGETELIINTTDLEGKNVASTVSVSVLDSVSGFYARYPFPDIGSTFLYEKDFYNNLPAAIQLKGLGNISSEDIDLLLMTYGWRRFKIKVPSDTVVVRELKSYDYLKIKNHAPEKKVRKEITVISIEGSESISLTTNKKNEALLAFDSLGTSVRQVMILPDQNKLKNEYPVNIEFPENKEFIEKMKLSKSGESSLQVNITSDRTIETDSGPDSVIMIDPVIIKGSKAPAETYLNKYQIQYRNTSPYTLTRKEFKEALFFEDILFRMNPFMIDTKRKMVYMGARTGRSHAPALIVVDDNPLWAPPEGRESRWLSTYAEIADMPASNISSVTMIKGQQGYTTYGEAALGGVIFVTTNGKAMSEGYYEDAESGGSSEKNDLAKPIRIFRSEIEYYVPEKEEVASNPEFSFRPTLLWAGDLISDGSGPVKIKYPNNMVKGTIIVIINGVSFTNMTGSNSYKYKIK